MNLKDVVKNDLWACCEGMHNDLPFILRFRQELDTKGLDFSEYPHLILIFWPFEGTKLGMPNDNDLKQMEVFENRLVEALENDLSGILTSVILTNGYKEWVYYVSSVDIFSERLCEMPQEDELYPIEIETDKDPNWSYFFDNVKPEEEV